jgi:hypothetical protein
MPLAGVINQHVQAAVPLVHGGDHGGDGSFIAHVGGNSQGFGQCRCQLFQQLRRAGGEGHARASRGEQAGRGQADAPEGPGDQRYLVLNLHDGPPALSR